MVWPISHSEALVSCLVQFIQSWRTVWIAPSICHSFSSRGSFRIANLVEFSQFVKEVDRVSLSSTWFLLCNCISWPVSARVDQDSSIKLDEGMVRWDMRWSGNCYARWTVLVEQSSWIRQAESWDSALYKRSGSGFVGREDVFSVALSDFLRVTVNFLSGDSLRY